MTYKWEAIAQDLTEERDRLKQALDILVSKSTMLSLALHDEESAGLALKINTDAAWMLMTVAIQEARAALKSEKQ